MFPSPIGVIFSLIQVVIVGLGFMVAVLFPSPIGVIFSLIIIDDRAYRLEELR